MGRLACVAYLQYIYIYGLYAWYIIHMIQKHERHSVIQVQSLIIESQKSDLI